MPDPVDAPGMVYVRGLLLALVGAYVVYVAPEVAARLGEFAPERGADGRDVRFVRIVGGVMAVVGAGLFVSRSLSFG